MVQSAPKTPPAPHLRLSHDPACGYSSQSCGILLPQATRPGTIQRNERGEHGRGPAPGTIRQGVAHATTQTPPWPPSAQCPGPAPSINGAPLAWPRRWYLVLGLLNSMQTFHVRLRLSPRRLHCACSKDPPTQQIGCGPAPSVAEEAGYVGETSEGSRLGQGSLYP